MLNVNFVPDDYVKSNESRRTNFMYLVLFALVMAGLGGSFVTIKIRQRAVTTKEEFLSAKAAQAQEAIEQFEALQTRRKIILKTALTTAELLEPVPRSVLLASLTNNLPAGVSLLQLNVIQKAPKRTNRVVAPNKYKKAQSKKAVAQAKESPEKLLETYMDIEGVAPSDLQVAAYIKQLIGSALLDNVALVESKEKKIEDTAFRQFKLKAMLRKEVHLSSEDIEEIRTISKTSAWTF
ncbi:MAG: PilN domain-containing protein [Planctomycetes bacterium]|nr:PilN domain-containing protein [Planctomycetota bacterium]